MNSYYQDKLVNKVFLRAASKLFLPISVRNVVTTVKSVKYIGSGVKTLLKGKMEVPVLDATAIGVSMLRNDFNTAGSVMFLLGIGEIIENEDLKEMIEIIEKQVNDSDYTAMDIAAAFLKQALGQVNLENDRENGEIDWDNTGAEEGMVRLFINIGKKDRVKPGDILGAIAGESGMPGKLVGAIDMYDKYTFVEVPREYGKEVLEAMKNVKIKGRSVNMEPANQK